MKLPEIETPNPLSADSSAPAFFEGKWSTEVVFHKSDSMNRQNFSAVRSVSVVSRWGFGSADVLHTQKPPKFVQEIFRFGWRLNKTSLPSRHVGRFWFSFSNTSASHSVLASRRWNNKSIKSDSHLTWKYLFHSGNGLKERLAFAGEKGNK